VLVHVFLKIDQRIVRKSS